MFPMIKNAVRDSKIRAEYATAFTAMKPGITHGVDMLMALELERRLAQYMKAHKAYTRESYAKYTNQNVSVIWMVLDICTLKLESGTHHFWWGGVDAKGKQLHQVIENCLELLVYYKEISAKDSAKVRAEVGELISSAKK